MLRKSMAERKMRFFGHIVRKNGIEKRLMQGKMRQTSNDPAPGFDRNYQAGHCCCITTGDRSGKMVKNHQSRSSADSATSRERDNFMHFLSTSFILCIGPYLLFYTTKIGTFVCPPHISETFAVRIMKRAHHSRIASTTKKII